MKHDNSKKKTLKRQGRYAINKVWTVTEIYETQRIRGCKSVIRRLVRENHLSLAYAGTRSKWYISERSIRDYEESCKKDLRTDSIPKIYHFNIPPDCRLA